MEFCKVADLVGVKTDSKDESSEVHPPSSGMVSARKRADEEIKRLINQEKAEIQSQRLEVIRESAELRRSMEENKNRLSGQQIRSSRDSKLSKSSSGAVIQGKVPDKKLAHVRDSAENPITSMIQIEEANNIHAEEEEEEEEIVGEEEEFEEYYDEEDENSVNKSAQFRQGSEVSSSRFKSN